MEVEDIILSPEAVSKVLSMIREKEILQRHNYSIYQGKDGNWYTYIPDESRPGGRWKVKKPTYDLVKAEVIKHYEQDSISVEELFTTWNDRRQELKEDTKQNGANTYYGARALYALNEMAKNDVWPDWRFGDNDCNVWSLFRIIHITKES